MKIESSAILMSSAHQYESSTRKDENLQVWIDPSASDSTSDTVTLSQAAGVESIFAGEDVLESDPKLLMMKILIEALTGREIRLADVRALAPSGGAEYSPAEAASGESEPRAGWGVRYDLQETRTESEKTGYSARGIVRTAEGSEIAFKLDLSMSREFVEQTNLSIRAGDATRIDPLVINFSGRAAELTDWTFDFDLNADGRGEAIPFVAGGSGFLVFDRNQDGQVNDGKELFGPASGNGFEELAQLDKDGNSWIDEADPDYSKLSVWTRNADGSGGLRTLQESGLGALNVAFSSSPFDLKDARNDLRGQILRTGLYLAESGKAGTMQQLDLFV